MWPWPLNSWPWECHQGHVDLLMSFTKTTLPVRPPTNRHWHCLSDHPQTDTDTACQTTHRQTLTRFVAFVTLSLTRFDIQTWPEDSEDVLVYKQWTLKVKAVKSLSITETDRQTDRQTHRQMWLNWTDCRRHSHVAVHPYILKTGEEKPNAYAWWACACCFSFVNWLDVHCLYVADIVYDFQS